MIAISVSFESFQSAIAEYALKRFKHKLLVHRCQAQFESVQRKVYMTRMATLERTAKLNDVAREAGVSQGTVSNVFNRPEIVSEEVRERVREVAARLGYKGADPKGRLLRAGKVNAIGVAAVEPLEYFFTDPFARLMMTGVTEGLRRCRRGPVADLGRERRGAGLEYPERPRRRSHPLLPRWRRPADRVGARTKPPVHRQLSRIQRPEHSSHWRRQYRRRANRGRPSRRSRPPARRHPHDAARRQDLWPPVDGRRHEDDLLDVPRPRRRLPRRAERIGNRRRRGADLRDAGRRGNGRCRDDRALRCARAADSHPCRVRQDRDLRDGVAQGPWPVGARRCLDRRLRRHPRNPRPPASPRWLSRSPRSAVRLRR